MGVASPGSDDAQQALDEGVSVTVDDMTDPAAALEVLPGSLRPVRAAPPVDLISTAYDSHQRALYSFALRTARDPEVAADLVQEAFLRLLGELKAGHPPDNVRAWLYRVVSNLAVSRGRHLKVAERFLHVLRRDEIVEEPESSYLARESRDDIDRLLGSLAPDERQALVLSAHNFSGEEIAAALGRTNLATRALLCRARAKLRERVDRPEEFR